jgi:TonB family protein
LSGRQAVLDVSAPTGPLASGEAALTRPALGDTGGPTENKQAARDMSAPALIRGGVADQPNAYVRPTTAGPLAATPVTGAQVVPPASTFATGAGRLPKYRAPRYETPQTVGTINTTGGSTMNGWDTPTPRPRSKRSGVGVPVVLKPATAVANSGYVPPRPMMQVMPNTRSIPSGTIQARTRVEVQVNVDQAGRVSAAHVVSPGVNDKVSSAALSAARQWTFDPASNNGAHVMSEHTIVFEFRPEQR